MTSRNDRGSSALKRTQALCRDYGLSVPTDVHTVQVLIKDAFVVLGSSRDCAESFIEHKECKANKGKPEASLKATESRSSDAQRRGPEI